MARTLLPATVSDTLACAEFSHSSYGSGWQDMQPLSRFDTGGTVWGAAGAELQSKEKTTVMVKKLTGLDMSVLHSVFNIIRYSESK